MAMRCSHNLHTIYKAEVIEHPFLPDMGIDLTCANTIIYSSSNFAVILILAHRFLFLYLYLNF